MPERIFYTKYDKNNKNAKKVIGKGDYFECVHKPYLLLRKGIAFCLEKMTTPLLILTLHAVLIEYEREAHDGDHCMLDSVDPLWVDDISEEGTSEDDAS